MRRSSFCAESAPQLNSSNAMQRNRDIPGATRTAGSNDLGRDWIRILITFRSFSLSLNFWSSTTWQFGALSKCFRSCSKFHNVLYNSLKGDLALEGVALKVDPAFIEAIKHLDAWCRVLHALRLE